MMNFTEKIYTLHKEYPYYPFDKKYFYDNQDFIRFKIFPENPIKVYFYQSDKMITVLLKNLTAFPIHILFFNDKKVSRDLALWDEGLILKLNGNDNRQSYNQIRFALPENGVGLNEISSLKISYNLPYSNMLRTIDALPWPYDESGINVQNTLRQEANFTDFSFLEVSDSTIRFKEGQWTIEKDLIIPKGYNVICDGNTKIDLQKSSNIISYSPIKFIGNENKFIHIVSSDSSGQGVIVLNTNELSILSHVIFDNLSKALKYSETNFASEKIL